MKPEIKSKWLEALRSGSYKQGKGCLRDEDNNFCCLGVLCDLHSKEFGNRWEFKRFRTGYIYEGNRNLPPISVARWSGLQLSVLRFIYDPGAQRTLIEMNDTGKSFAKIADYIEEHL